ncbi:hypothetical protein LOAG_14192 [Loa loa]|uniref:Secreted protein n=1 Tax=Loa loa TaxID=7209 RepID=A0A1S0TI16_LOALO|nr:hypothetical protein LOAG_14192 [Loa loa]EFO14330.1 hypothetical protein LOAG_14192 [Loa loa]
MTTYQLTNSQATFLLIVLKLSTFQSSAVGHACRPIRGSVSFCATNGYLLPSSTKFFKNLACLTVLIHTFQPFSDTCWHYRFKISLNRQSANSLQHQYHPGRCQDESKEVKNYRSKILSVYWTLPQSSKII